MAYKGNHMIVDEKELRELLKSEPKDPSEFRNLGDWINHRYGEWITVKEAAKLYKYTTTNIHYLVKHKQIIKAHKKGHVIMILKSSFDEYERLKKLLN